MTRSALAALLLIVSASIACRRPAPPPPPPSVRTVAVLPVANHTGDGLLISGTSLLEKYVFRTDRVTVPDAMGAELRGLLAAHGFAIVDPARVEGASEGRVPGSAAAAAELARRAGLEGAALWVDVRRWDPDAPMHADYVIVALDAALVDPRSGAVLWQTQRASSPVPTPGAVTLGSAYVIAVEKVAAELVGSWTVASSPSPGHASEP